MLGFYSNTLHYIIEIWLEISCDDHQRPVKFIAVDTEHQDVKVDYQLKLN